MTLRALLRGGLALIVGLTVTVVTGLTIVIVGIVYNPLHHMVSTGNTNPVRRLANLWAWLIHWICIRRLLNCELRIEDKSLRPRQNQEVVVVIANHPSTMGLASFFWYVFRHLRRNVLIIVKNGHRFNPVIGWAGWLISSFVFINRKNRATARRAIKQGLASGFDPTTDAIVVFADSRRPTRERIRANRAEMRGKIPGLEYWPLHTRTPGITGLLAILKTIKPEHLRVVCLGNGFNIADEGVKDIPRLVDQRFCLRVFARQRPPADTEAFTRWLNDLYLEINFWLEVERHPAH